MVCVLLLGRESFPPGQYGLGDLRLLALSATEFLVSDGGDGSDVNTLATASWTSAVYATVLINI